MARAHFVVALEGIKVTEDMGRGDKFFDDLFITNNTNTLKGLLEDKTVIRMLGGIEVNHLFTSGAIVYGKFDLDPKLYGMSFLVDTMYKVQAFLNASWFYSDSSINQDNAYLIIDENDKPETFHTNNIHLNSLTSKGEIKEIEISRTEIKKIRDLAMTLYDKHEIAEGRNIRNKLFIQESRLARAIYIAQHARNERTPEIRLSQLVSSLEALLVDSNSEVSHILAERVAIFLETDLEKRVELFNKVKKCYNYRSKVFHGDSVKEKQFDEVNEYVVFIEGIVKNCLLKVIESSELTETFSLPNEAFAEKMKRLVLS